jgi:glycolate oxidase iron-sulfur subunit
MTLHLDHDELASCVGCGLCLPHCPTYRVTGEETRSPRGRIRLMREVEWHDQLVDDEFVDAMDTCVQCRGCETACPSAVPFGRLMEGTREALAESGRTVPRWQRIGYRALGHQRLVRVGAVIAGRIPPLARRVGLTPVPVRRPPLQPSGTDVVLVTGCVMDATQRDVHIATQRVLEAAGYGVAFASGGCCGALASHAGLRAIATQQATDLADRIRAVAPDDVPVVVNSAGCGAQLKDLAHLVDTPSGRALAARTLDVHELLAREPDRLPVGRHLSMPVAVQDPCHLRHVQRRDQAVRAVLSRYADLVELDDEGLCCGAGGAYAVLQPELANEVRERKVAAIRRAGATVVASANPGCALHLQAAGLDVRHPMELVAEALSEPPRGER